MMNTKKSRDKFDYITYSNKNIGFSLAIPDNWLEVKKTSHKDLGINDNTLVVFAVDKFSALSILFSGFSKMRTFNQFFDKVRFDEKLTILTTGEKEFENVNVKYVITNYNDKKIMHCFCLINGMVINFSINIDIKNKIFDDENLLRDKNVEILFKVLATLKIFKPVNPPIYVEDVVEESHVEEFVADRKKTAELAIEMDCKYRHILIPDFYFKYNYERKGVQFILTIIDDEVYYNDLKDRVRFVKADENLSLEIEKIVSKQWNKLLKMDVGYRDNKSSSNLLIKLHDEYVLIDLLANVENREIINKLLDVVMSKVSKNSDSKVRFKLAPKINAAREDAKDSRDEKSVEVKMDVDVEEKRVLEKEKESDSTEEIESVKEDDSSKEHVDEEETVVEESRVDASKEENELAEISSEQKESDMLVSSLSEEEIDATLAKVNSDAAFSHYQPDQDKMEYDLTSFQEYLHNISGHASFKFLFPKDSGVKVDRDFNVFDIDKNGDLMYRIFIFKCENSDKYEEKLKDWMDKNVKSSSTNIKDSYRAETNTGLMIRTYILENDRFYKAIYRDEYLIAISGNIDQERLFYADLALENVQVGSDNGSYVEAFNRKMHSIDILKEQNIPYFEDLPVIESSYEVEGKTLEEIASRAIVLCICCNYASDILGNKKKRYVKDSKKFFNKLLDKFNVRDAMTPDERKLFEKSDKNLAIQTSWQFEGYLILLWALSLVDDIAFPDVLVNPDSITGVVSACDSYHEFVEKCKLRDVKEVLDLADLTYRYDWYCVDSHINGEEAVINPEVVMERDRALRWILTKEKWNEVKINT